MTGAMERPIPELVGRNRWWLPRVGVGYGLDDSGWTPVLEVDATLVGDLLIVLREEGVPAFASPTGSVVHRLRRGRLSRRSFLLWVGTSRYDTAEETLTRTLGPARGRSDRGGGRSLAPADCEHPQKHREASGSDVTAATVPVNGVSGPGE